ncbi:DNA alkylation repair protein [Olsenella massiliensis]|uniref:DNA alkylation repair protein n=1 Tax=Olsenella massiliensis TaxID=1622075 RepID=UPI00071E4D92|nr:DNA alkylation repair protein [Olsenella massiliensis]
MNRRIEELSTTLARVEHGFKEIEGCASADFASRDARDVAELARAARESETIQVRMYGAFLLGYLAAHDGRALRILKDVVSCDEDWRVQEILAKSFDRCCRDRGYEEALPIIDEWLSSDEPNVRRAVTEGLRIWTGRDYFREHPEEAVRRLSALREDASEYVRKSVGNALRDISKKHPDLIAAELASWKLDSKEMRQVHKLASRLLA